MAGDAVGGLSAEAENAAPGDEAAARRPSGHLSAEEIVHPVSRQHEHAEAEERA